MIQTTVSPIDQTIYAQRDLATQQEIDRTFQQAKHAQSAWKNTPLSERQNICKKAMAWFEQHEQELAHELCWMIGRPIRQCAGEIKGMLERAHHMIEISTESLATTVIEDSKQKKRYIVKEPLGTAFVISPWNYPYLTSVNAIIPALLAGNVVITKHSPQTPLCAERFYQAFQEAGLPAYVYQYLHMSPTAVSDAIKQQPFEHITFTGSVEVGKLIEQACAQRFLSIHLELGGKDAAYICADANLDHAVEQCVSGAFFNSGQSCCSLEKIYVHQDLYDEFLKKCVEKTYQYQLIKPNDPTCTLGPVVSLQTAEKIKNLLDDALHKGAKEHINSVKFHHMPTHTNYIAPQILTNIHADMRIMHEEIFGPVVTIEPVTNDENALHLINKSAFGLSASIFTKNIEQGALLAEKIDVGTCFINHCDYLDPALAWSGTKNSGKGCSLSTFGFDQLTRTKSFSIKSSEA